MANVTRYYPTRVCILLLTAGLLAYLCHEQRCVTSIRMHLRIEETIPMDEVVNPHPFKFLLSEADTCQNVSASEPFLLVFVTSDPSRFEFREAIRATWANPNLTSFGLDHGVRMKVLFSMGYVEDRALMEKVRRESEHYHDIVQEDFLDTYRNLTYKSIMWLKWSFTYCPQAFQTLKVDDDVFLNRFSLLKRIRHLFDEGKARHRTITCAEVRIGHEPQRDTTDKWYVPVEDFADEVYPMHCPGQFNMLSRDMPRLLYLQSLKTKFFWLEDVYVTGILAKRIPDVTHTDSGMSFWGMPAYYGLGTWNFNKYYVQVVHVMKWYVLHYEYWNVAMEAYGLKESGEKRRDPSSKSVENRTAAVDSVYAMSG